MKPCVLCGAIGPAGEFSQQRVPAGPGFVFQRIFLCPKWVRRLGSPDKRACHQTCRTSSGVSLNTRHLWAYLVRSQCRFLRKVKMPFWYFSVRVSWTVSPQLDALLHSVSVNRPPWAKRLVKGCLVSAEGDNAQTGSFLHCPTNTVCPIRAARKRQARKHVVKWIYCYNFIIRNNCRYSSI